MVGELASGDETLFERIFLHHFGACQNTLKRNYKASHEDAYDSVMWAMLRMRQLLLEKKVGFGNLEAYLIRMANNHYLKKQMRSREITVATLPDDQEEETPVFDEEMVQALGKAWSKLEEKCQILLKGFYYDKIELKQMTTHLNDSSEANTRKRKERCINALRKLFFEFC